MPVSPPERTIRTLTAAQRLGKRTSKQIDADVRSELAPPPLTSPANNEARTVKQKLEVSIKQQDGSTLRARIEKRAEGTYAIDLRAWQLGRPTLKAPGALYGTKLYTEAQKYGRHQLEAIAQSVAVGTAPSRMGPTVQITEYIEDRIALDAMTRETGAAACTCILRIWAYFVDTHRFTSWRQVQKKHVSALAKHLRETTFARGRLKRNSVLKHFNYTKGFLRWCVDSEIIPANPFEKHRSIPRRDMSFVRDWLEPNEVGALLAVSFAGRPNYPKNACAAWPEILATQAYTGARENEVLGLMLDDVTFDGGEHGVGVIHFRNNPKRRLKNEKSKREFSMWPVHATILKDYLAGVKPAAGGLLFPGRNGKMWSELRESMARDLKAARITKKITDHSMRHSYISARASMYTPTLVDGATVYVQVSDDEIRAEVGHGSARMTREVYKHASKFRVKVYGNLDYATAFAVFRKGLTKPRTGRAAATRSRTASTRR